VAELAAGARALIAPVGAGRLDRWLSGALPASRGRIAAWIAEERVRVDGRPGKAAQRLSGGERVEIEVPEPAPPALIPQDLGVPVLWQDEAVIVVNKPAGLVVHPAAGHRDGTLVNALLPDLEAAADEDAPERPGIVHRLDRGTSGVLVVARTAEAMSALSAQFAEHSVERRYLALVWGEPRDASGTVDAPLGRHPTDRKRFAVVRSGKRAVTHWRRLQGVRLSGGRASVPLSLLECRLETGRTHQVRVHLAHLGLPVVGDPVYGRRGATPEPLRAALDGLDHQLLHAAILGFTHPISGERMRWELPPPEDFLAVLAAAGMSL